MPLLRIWESRFLQNLVAPRNSHLPPHPHLGLGKESMMFFFSGSSVLSPWVRRKTKYGLVDGRFVPFSMRLSILSLTGVVGRPL